MQQPNSGPRAEALAAYHRGDADALERLDAALGHAPLDGGLLIARATLAQELGHAEPLARLREVLGAAPDWLDGHVALARLRWGAGERETFLDLLETALRALPRHAGLWMRYMSLLADSGAALKAADVAADLRRSGGDAPALRLIEAGHAGSGGAHERAWALLQGLPDMPGLDAAVARQLLRRGAPEASIARLERARAADPGDATLWALTELAWRAAGDPRHGWLLREGLHGAMDLPIAAEELAALARALHALHDRRWPPLGQSVRGGTQTRGDLKEHGDPAVARLFGMLGEAVAAHMAALPAADPGHPLLALQDRPTAIASAWSIRVEGAGAGHHVSHVHPGGVLSSAFYVEVPEALDASTREGWLELGRPPADIPLGLPPIAAVAPRPARLVLFPSYLYHGTRPFRAGRRMSVAFDVVPALR
jgi:tetratricopeptide (TPR) repeat protein